MLSFFPLNVFIKGCIHCYPGAKSITSRKQGSKKKQQKESMSQNVPGYMGNLNLDEILKEFEDTAVATASKKLEKKKKKSRNNSQGK